jgi:signal transduction histidine kinase
LWIGTGGSGLCRYKDGKLITYTTLQGLFSDDIFEIVEDDNGWLWMTCSKGIFRVSKKNLDDFDKHKTLSIRCIAYGKADGMESIQCSGVAKPGAWKGRDGRLWFATAKGLVVADPQLNLAGNDKLPAVIIEEVIADQQPSAIPAASGGSAALTIPPGRGDLEIHYTTTSLEEPEKNRFKYKLDGIDSDWVEVTRRVAYYNNLRPGNYQFHVIACNNDGVWNHAGASVALVLRPHLWQTWWFRGTAALLAALLAAGIARYLTRRNIQQELQRLEKQHAVEQERIRIARDMHDEIGAKLTKISFLGALAKRKISLPDEAGTQIDKMSQTARDVIRALDEIVWAVNPANDSLEDLATYLCRNATEFFDNSPIVCQFNIPAELPAWRLGMDVRHNLLLAAKDALNNVLKHSGATKVHVQISVVSEWFEVEIADNGRGFAQSDAANGSGSVSKKPSRVGNGLANMRQRLESIGGRCYVESRAGEGTRILFRIYVSGRVSDWISKRGEVAGMGKD